MSRIGKIARRTFLVGSAAVVGGVAFGAYYINRPAPNPLQPAEGQAVPNPFVVVDQDGVTLVAPRAEMGQGVHTTWAALIAEELDVDLAQVRVIHGPAAAAYYNTAMMGALIPGKKYEMSGFTHGLAEQLGKVGKLMGMQVTGGSTSMVDGFTRMREAGASARETLKEAAAQRLGVERSRLTTEGGKVIAPGNIELTYEELAPDAAKIDVVTGVALRDPSAWTILGKSVPRVDMVAKSTGTAGFGIDVRVPGMKFAALKCNPARSGMNGFDATQALKMPGVEQVVDLGDGFAVVATNTWLAIQAAEAVVADWEAPTYPATTDAIMAEITRTFDTDPDSTMRDDGDPSTIPAGATEVSAEYTVPYLAHATMEPMNATAHLKDGKLTVWCGNQAPIIVQEKCAEAAGVPQDAVEVNTTYLGGGFGRRGDFDYAVYAAKLARAMEGTPVQLAWSREEDMSRDFYRPAAIARMTGAVQDGKVVLLDGQIASQAVIRQFMTRIGIAPMGPDKQLVEGAFNQPYGIPNYRIRGYATDMTLPVGSWRSVGNSHNAFFHECFIDELAHAAGADPLEMRYELIRDVHAPSAGTLSAVRELSGWTGSTPDGVGRGAAFCYSFGTPVAMVVEVVDEDGAIRIAKAWIACDVGIALDPGIIEAQMTGAMIYGLSAACTGEITFTDGAAEQQNFWDYDALRIHNSPLTQVKVLETNPYMGGAGEPGTPPSMPALANAIFDLTGKRPRSLPLSHAFDFVS
ncbi:xanthine dehydrogenase family protein molybdopterin-binding subunit [Chachezhania antarctica]|uniref:xanthine dehydrogenase family protein molybdopterin-binding subunit n=1 Tax=Chachezhania antarctica TaxID=2340860 RepID=UPI000EB56963|nr:molybdopterin cofactor-binding domain-containing protein [Chachezhania antarctica]|tara:strand:+ start:1936 stop:4173 length:2238 start_codon:yes stop_codon:yes gene_type:complete